MQQIETDVHVLKCRHRLADLCDEIAVRLDDLSSDDELEFDEVQSEILLLVDQLGSLANALGFDGAPIVFDPEHEGEHMITLTYPESADPEHSVLVSGENNFMWWHAQPELFPCDESFPYSDVIRRLRAWTRHLRRATNFEGILSTIAKDFQADSEAVQSNRSRNGASPNESRPALVSKQGRPSKWDKAHVVSWTDSWKECTGGTDAEAAKAYNEEHRLTRKSMAEKLTAEKLRQLRHRLKK